LFDRRAKGYVLTAEGKAVLKEATAMDEAAVSVLRRLDAGTELSGLVRLAAGRVLAERFLIDRLRAFHERYPAIDLEVIGGSRVVSLAKRKQISRCDTGRPTTVSLLPDAWERSPSAFTHRPAIATSSRPGNRPPSSVLTKRATSSARRSGWPASSATSGFHFAPTARQRRLQRLARIMALRFFQDTSWRLMSRTSWRCRWEDVRRSAMSGFWSAVI